jgi:hypothetical protein
MSGFQTTTTVQPAIGVEGDFSSANPRFSVISGAGAFLAGASGVVIGRFAWANNSVEDDVGGPAIVNSFGSGPVTGFVHREFQALLTQYLQEFSMLVPAGFGVTLMNGGDFIVKNRGTTQALIGQKAYANFADGSISFAPTGSPAGGGTSTASTIAPQTNSFVGNVVSGVETNQLNVTGNVVGTIQPGTVLAAAGLAAGTSIVQQLLPLLAGEALGGVGRYALSIPEQNLPAGTAFNGTYGLLTIGGTVAGTYGAGQPVSGGATLAGTTITALGTGVGGAGTYLVNLTQTVGSGSLNTASNIETKWIAMSPGQPGELVKISDHPLG